MKLGGTQITDVSFIQILFGRYHGGEIFGTPQEGSVMVYRIVFDRRHFLCYTGRPFHKWLRPEIRAEIRVILPKRLDQIVELIKQFKEKK